MATKTVKKKLTVTGSAISGGLGGGLGSLLGDIISSTYNIQSIELMFCIKVIIAGLVAYVSGLIIIYFTNRKQSANN